MSKIVKKQLSLKDDQKVVAETKFADLGADSLDTVSHQSFSYVNKENLKSLFLTY